jgi:hypothetical protein
VNLFGEFSPLCGTTVTDRPFLFLYLKKKMELVKLVEGGGGGLVSPPVLDYGSPPPNKQYYPRANL